MSKQKIAVLGGGIAALTAIYELTSADDWQDNYDITLYQLGWRLGGKGASGRDQQNHNRIIEHGLHQWLGVYENAFNLMIRTYEELGRSSDQPFPTAQSAFTPVHTYVIQEPNCNDLWVTEFPTNNKFPGTTSDDPPSKIWDALVKMLKWLVSEFDKIDESDVNKPEVERPHWWDNLEGKVGEDLSTEAHKLLSHALKYAETLVADIAKHSALDWHILQWLLDRFRNWLRKEFEKFLDHHTLIRRAYIMLDLGITAVIGILRDGVLTNGWEQLDVYDLREWFSRNGASDYAVYSAPMKAIYDLLFAYENGDPDKPSIVAGSTLHGVIKMVTVYKGAPLWEMNSGTGDIVIAPLYLVLNKRGVKFAFFSKVTDLRLNDDHSAIQAIDMQQQVDVKDGWEYEPLIEINGLPCWPNEPLYDQLVQGQELKASGANIESRWTTWQSVGTKTLTAGVDFDKVILGISLGAFKDIVPELIMHSAKWQNLVNFMGTTPTQSVQLWFKRDMKGLGWDLDQPLYSYPTHDLSSWGDFSQIIPSEAWGDDVKDISYLVSPLKADTLVPPPPSDHDYPDKEADRVKDNGEQFLNTQTTLSWPDINQNGFDWNALADWYWRANVDPWERYVLATANTTQYRMRVDETDYRGLYVTGAWTYNIANVSSMEAAVISGKLCAAAVSGKDIPIIGVKDLRPHD